MSYNIDTIRYIRGGLTIAPAEAAVAREEFRDELPEDTFLDDVLRRHGKTGGDPVPIERPAFRGEASGYGFAAGVFHKLLGRTKGEAELLVVWEGGDSIAGYRVRDGRVTEHAVAFSLGEEIRGG